jgi:hypothetical protein
MRPAHPPRKRAGAGVYRPCGSHAPRFRRRPTKKPRGGHAQAAVTTPLQERLCKEHKDKDHVLFGNKRCEHEGCEIHAAYGSEEDGIARLCMKHKGVHHVDVVSKVCRHEGCEILSDYGSKEDSKRLFCLQHKHAEHVHLSNKRCQHEGCEITAGRTGWRSTAKTTRHPSM